MNKALDIMNLNYLDLNNMTNIQLKKIYHKQALIFHPDKGGSCEKFKELQEAFEYLSILIDLNSYEKNDDFENIKDKNIIEKIQKYIMKYINNLSFNYLNECNTSQLNTIELILNFYKNKIPENIYNKIANILNSKNNSKDLILTPSLDDLFDDKIFRLNYENEIFNVPLWHSELYYDTKNNKEICIKCIPILPESIEIDNNNNIHIHLLKNKDEIFINQYCNMQLTEKINFKIHSHEINFMPIQTIILKNNGISKISNANIYDNKVKSDIIITLQLY